MPRELKVKLVADARPFNNTLDAAAGKVTGFKKRLEATGGGSLTKGLAIGAGVASFNLLTSAVSAVVGQMDEMHNAFLADQESQLRLQNILKNTVKNYDAAVKSAEEFAGAQQSLGFEDDSVRDSLGQLVGITHDLAKAQELSSVALDLSRAKNIDLAQATDIVARAYTGVARGLTLVGIDARGATTGMELVKRIMDNTTGAAKTYATSGAGKIAAANAKMQDTFEKVGGAIDKISQVVIPLAVEVLSKLTDGFFTLADTLNSIVGPAFESITGKALTLLGVLQTISASVPGTGLLQFGGGQGAQGAAGKVIDISKLKPGQGVNIGVPIHHQGGIVAGPLGSDQLIQAQAGERIVPIGEKAGQTIIVNIASFIGSDRDIDRFADRLAFRLRSTALG